MSAGPTARRRVGRPPRIDTAMISSAACEIGLDRVTMRAVAERLGVSVATLYHHVSGRDELVRLASEQTAARMTTPEDRGQHWSEWLFEWAEHSRSGFVATPELLEQFLHGSVGFDRMLDLVDRAVGFLIGAGFDAVEAFEAYGLVTQCALGAAVAEIRRTEAAATGHPISDELEREMRARPATELVHLRALATAAAPEPTFRSQVATVLGGVAVRRGEAWEPIVARIEALGTGS